MDAHAIEFLNLRRLPGRLTAQQAGWVLGYDEAPIRVLVTSGLLKPLAGTDTGSLAFSSRAIMSLTQDGDFLERAEVAILRSGGNSKDASGSRNVSAPKEEHGLVPVSATTVTLTAAVATASVPAPRSIAQKPDGAGREKTIGGYKVKVNICEAAPGRQTNTTHVLAKIVATSLMRTEVA